MSNSQRPDRMTAEELMAQLRANPDVRAREEANERQIAQAQAEYAAAAEPVLTELVSAGYRISTVGELRTMFEQTGRTYESAVPILVRCLPHVTYRPLQDDIVRTLSVPWARRDATGALIERFRELPPHGGPTASDHRWTVGNALEVLAHQTVATDLMEIAQDRHYGEARQMVVLGLAKLKKDPRVIPVLLNLLDDPDVTGSAIMALGRLRATEARDRLQQFLEHPEPHYRKEARKALRMIN
ncbi:MAG TPA: hypothetical protein DGG94_17490 [Micromonosporaceae bacterium]|nr:hypothetical protein [Micromonosporaceae bacterium]